MVIDAGADGFIGVFRLTIQYSVLIYSILELLVSFKRSSKKFGFTSIVFSVFFVVFFSRQYWKRVTPVILHLGLDHLLHENFCQQETEFEAGDLV